MGAVVTFDYQMWLDRFPQFEASVSEAQANVLFIEATAFHANDGSGPITDANVQLTALNLLMAHLAMRAYGANGEGGAMFVGQLTNASQDGASVSVNPIVASGTQAWYLTTPYGSDYWHLTAAYRTMRYRPAVPTRIFDPLGISGTTAWDWFRR